MTDFNISDVALSNAQIAWRAAQDIEDGSYVNLGIGFPEMIAKFQPDGRDVTYHTENGVLGFGKAPLEGEEDWDLINAGKKAITLNPGASYFHHADSFAMVRGGHLDLAVLGAYQIARTGILQIGVSAPRVFLPLAVRWTWSMAQSGSLLSPIMSPKMANPS